MTDLHTKAQSLTKLEADRELVRLWELEADQNMKIATMLAERAAEHSHVDALAWLLNGDTPITLPQMVDVAREKMKRLAELEAKFNLEGEK